MRASLLQADNKPSYLRGKHLEPEWQVYVSEEGSGLLAVTNMAVYFLSPLKTKKSPLRRLLQWRVMPMVIAVTPDRANAKPQYFQLDDPWFAANVITRLNQL
jgi:hypothetical protein